MSNEFSLLNDAELETVSAGAISASWDRTSNVESGLAGTNLSRVKSSDKQQAAVLALLKG